jgi:2-dehydro-3-deoxygluconokinase
MNEVVTVGEALLRLGVQPGVRLETAPSLDVHVGGAEANVAVALAGLGRKVGWFSILPDNSLGRRVAETLSALGVNVSELRWVEQGRLGTYYVEHSVPPRPVRVIYDRADSAFSRLTTVDLPWDWLMSARVVQVSGITPALSAGCRAAVVELADRVRRSEAMWVVDVNHRARLWTADEARACLEEVAAGAGLVVCSREDARDVFDVAGPADAAAEELAERLDAARVVVTDGEAGAYWRMGPAFGHVPTVPATIVDRMGAGDALTAGVIDGVLDGDLERGVRQGVVMAALTLGMRGDHLRTSREEVDRLMGGPGRGVDR